MHSKFLESKKSLATVLVSKLGKYFKYVSILGTDVDNKMYRADVRGKDISDSMSAERGFVVKVNNGRAFYEYSFDNFDDVDSIVKVMKDNYLSPDDKEINALEVKEEKLVKSFEREGDFDKFSEEEILAKLDDYVKELKAKDGHVLNSFAILNKLEVNKLFVSKEKCLDQHYTWANVYVMVVYRDGDKVVEPREQAYSNKIGECFDKIPALLDKVIDKGRHLVKATQIKPGVYDIITDPSITGLIAHEAFGHGVEMDQFVKERALAKKYVGDYVASPITNMHDGASSGFSTASYFFDDDGVLAHDTLVIDKGILVKGICDLTSSRELGVEPTGNGRRESYKRKAYTRMTNTFFEPGKDKLEDMIKSVKHGYFLFETNNGMEDPKNWAIQCTAEYGIEIVDGKLTDNYVAPVVMSGYVPDLLKSISMISDEFELEGSGSCGKGYKEWVRVSSGGPYLKAKVKLS